MNSIEIAWYGVCYLTLVFQRPDCAIEHHTIFTFRGQCYDKESKNIIGPNSDRVRWWYK